MKRLAVNRAVAAVSAAVGANPTPAQGGKIDWDLVVAITVVASAAALGLAMLEVADPQQARRDQSKVAGGSSDPCFDRSVEDQRSRTDAHSSVRPAFL
jgi:hypothetical protein